MGLEINRLSPQNHGPGRLGTGQVSDTGRNPGGKIPWPAVTLTKVIPDSLRNGFQLRSLITEKKGCVGQLSWDDHHLFIKMERTPTVHRALCLCWAGGEQEGAGPSLFLKVTGHGWPVWQFCLCALGLYIWEGEIKLFHVFFSSSFQSL